MRALAVVTLSGFVRCGLQDSDEQRLSFFKLADTRIAVRRPRSQTVCEHDCNNDDGDDDDDALVRACELISHD